MKYTWMALIGALFLTTGCELSYRGCMDPEATNYDATADTDDGSCTYEGQAVFWYGSAVAQDLDAYFSDTLTFYVEGEAQIVTATDMYWSVAPDCGEYNTYTVTASLPGGEPRVVSYQVIDNFDDVLWDGIVAFNLGGCTAIELE